MSSIENAICRITVSTTDTHHLTGWLFTNYGHVLTAGHTFNKIKASLNSEHSIMFDDDVTIYTAVLLDYVYDYSKCLDYAVLQISGLPKFGSFRNKMPITHYANREYQNRRFTSLGYRESITPDSATNIEGKILGIVTQHHNHNWVQLSIDGKRKLNGLSGAPIVINGKAIAIQSSQGKEEINDSFATRIDAIPNKWVKKVLEGKFIPTSFNYTLVNDSDWPSRTLIKKHRHKRYALIYNDHLDPSGNQQKIYSGYGGEYGKQKQLVEYKKIIRDIEELTGILLPEVSWDIHWLTKGDTTVLHETLTKLIDEDGIIDFGDYLRIVIDTSNTLINNTDAVFKSHSNNVSHIVGVSLKHSDHNSISIKQNDNFDLYYIIEYCTSEYATSCLHNITIDTILDIVFFMLFFGNDHNYNTIEAKRQFSKHKTSYILQNADYLKINGSPLPNDSKYVSFASFARERSDKALSINKFICIWDEFYRHCLSLAKINLHKKENDYVVDGTHAMSINQTIEAVKSIPKIGRQISKNKLTKELNDIPKSLYGTNLVLAVVCKKPKKTIDEERIKSMFGKEYKRCVFKIFKASEKNKLRSIIHLLELFHFKIKSN